MLCAEMILSIGLQQIAAIVLVVNHESGAIVACAAKTRHLLVATRRGQNFIPG